MNKHLSRIRDFGIIPGTLPPGGWNAITDVPGVRVGHTTLIEGDSVRTGVTAILPHGGDLYTYKVPAAVHTINGFGKATGFEQVRELGALETPILLTNTLNVGRVSEAVIAYVMQEQSRMFSLNPLVGETNDGYLNDIRNHHIEHEHVFNAIDSASIGPVQEGCVGAGTGTSCYQFKGGIGTASRQIVGEYVTTEYTVGTLVQTNLGRRAELRILGHPIGQQITELMPGQTPDGSIMIVLATDAPLTSRQLGRMARRATFGLARTGTIGHHGSGDFVIAFSTARPRVHTPHQIAQPYSWIMDESPVTDLVFQAVVESVEEAIYNALVVAETITGRNGHTLHALPHDKLQTLIST